MNLRNRKPTTVALTPVDPQTATQTLQERRNALRDLEQEAEVTESRLADLLASRALGGTVDVDELQRLVERRETIAQERDELEMILTAMEGRVAEIVAQEGERDRDVLRPEFERIGAEIVRREAEYVSALGVLSDALDGLQRARQRHIELSMAWSRTAGSNTEGHGVPTVRPLIDIPDRVMRAQRLTLDPTLREIAEAWATEPERIRERNRIESERTAANQAEERRKAQAALDRHIANWGPADKAPAEVSRIVYY